MTSYLHRHPSESWGPLNHFSNGTGSGDASFRWHDESELDRLMKSDRAGEQGMSAFLIVIPAKAGTQLFALRAATFVSIAKWIPAFAGMTE